MVAAAPVEQVVFGQRAGRDDAHDGLEDELAFEGDQLCKQYWLNAKSEVKDRDFFEEYDKRIANIEFIPMSQDR